MRKLIPILSLTIALFSITIYSAAKPHVLILPFTETGNKVADLNAVAKSKIADVVVTLGSINVMEEPDYISFLADQGIDMESITEENLPQLYGKDTLGYVITGDVSKGVVTKTLKTEKKAIKNSSGKITGYNETKYWLWSSTPSMKLKIIDLKTGATIYSQSRSGKRTSKEKYEAPSSSIASDIAKIINASKGQVEEEIDPNTVKPDLAIAGAQYAAGRHYNALFNTFRPTGTVLSIKPIDEKGKKFECKFDIGKDLGLKVGQKLEVVEIGESIKHPTTGEMIPGEEEVITDFKVKDEPGSAMTTVELRKKDASIIKVGMLVKVQKK